MDDGWITVPNWRRFQHYKDRSPSWIKVYTDLNSRDEWLRLSCGQRGLLVTTWLEYARSSTHLKVDLLPRLVNKGDLRYVRRNLDALNHAGFIQVSASTDLEELLTSDVVHTTLRELTDRYGENLQ